MRDEVFNKWFHIGWIVFAFDALITEPQLTIGIRAHRVEMALVWDKASMLKTAWDCFDDYIEGTDLRNSYQSLFEEVAKSKLALRIIWKD